MAGKPIRLGKAASELNVGLPSLVEFLESKGVKIDSNPNTKLDPEHFDLLCTEFAADQSMKEQSKGPAMREKRESLSLKDVREGDRVDVKSSSEEEDEADINLDEIKRQVFSAPKAVEQIPTIEIKEKEVPIELTQVPEEKKEVSVQIVGKIDLDAINQKTRPDKKTPIPEAPKEKIEAVIKEVSKVDEVPVDAAENQAIETIRSERKVLSGPTVLGKIELPVEKPKTPSIQAESANSKRKRKRIKKVDTPPATQSPSGQATSPASKGTAIVQKRKFRNKISKKK